MEKHLTVEYQLIIVEKITELEKSLFFKNNSNMDIFSRSTRASALLLSLNLHEGVVASSHIVKIL